MLVLAGRAWETLSPPAGGSEGRAPPPKGIPIGGLSLDDAALIMDEYGDRVALRRSVLELATKIKKAPADSSATFKVAGETKSFPAPADRLLISIGGEGGLHSENLMTGDGVETFRLVSAILSRIPAVEFNRMSSSENRPSCR